MIYFEIPDKYGRVCYGVKPIVGLGSAAAFCFI